MKVTPTLVKRFEEEQKMFGTPCALHNLLVELSYSLLKDLYVKKMSLSYFPFAMKRRGEVITSKEK